MLIFGGSPSRATLTGKLSLLLIGPAMVPVRPLYVAETFWLWGRPGTALAVRVTAARERVIENMAVPELRRDVHEL